MTPQAVARRSLAIVTLFTLAATLSLTTVNAPAADADDPASERVWTKLRQPIPVSFDSNRLENVIEYFRNVTGVNFFVDWNAVKEIGVTRGSTVTLFAHNVPGDKALGLTLQSVDGRLAFSVDKGVVAITTAAVTHPDNTAEPGGKLPGNVGIQLVKVADGFIDPVNIVSARDGSGRLFVVERPGTVRIIDKDGEVLKKPFLDIRQTVVSSFVEQGLYDLEFHPNYKDNGRFFVHYSDMWFNGDSFIARYNVDPDNPDKADRRSSKVIMTIEQPYANHNGGELVFGPDGYLYIGSGDGGWEGDVLNAGQRLDTLLAKILRIDVNKTDSDRAYSIPKDNPFQTPKQQMVLFGVSEEAFAEIHPNARPEIWAYGVRNPVKMQFDRKTGDLYIADVGQNHWEEVSFQPADSKGGENYGWKHLCGTHPFPIDRKDAPKIGVMPIAQYNHANDGICVIGFGVARPPAYEGDLDGVYLFGDWGSGKVWGVKRDATGKWVMQELADTELMFTGAGEDELGNLYVTTASANYGGPVDPADNPRGAVWKVVPAGRVIVPDAK